MKFTHFLFTIAIGLFFSQCSKSKVEEIPICIAHQYLADGYDQPIFKVVFPVSEMAYFNPNNSNEITYRLADLQNSAFHLVKHNLATQEKEVIYQGLFAAPPRWGKNGWILLNVLDSLGYNIYKIRDNGEDLTALTTSGNCFAPEWNISSDKLIYQFAFTTPEKYILCDENGVFIDTLLSGVTEGSSWQHDSLMASGIFKGLVISNPLNDTLYTIYEKENLAQSLNGAVWLDNERVFWCHTTGIFVTNILTGETEVIRETCNAHCYQRPTYAADKNKIIVEKLERIKDTETAGRQIITLVMMNPDGTEEEELSLE